MSDIDPKITRSNLPSLPLFVANYRLKLLILLQIKLLPSLHIYQWPHMVLRLGAPGRLRLGDRRLVIVLRGGLPHFKHRHLRYFVKCFALLCQSGYFQDSEAASKQQKLLRGWFLLCLVERRRRRWLALPRIRMKQLFVVTALQRFIHLSVLKRDLGRSILVNGQRAPILEYKLSQLLKELASLSLSALQLLLRLSKLQSRLLHIRLRRLRLHCHLWLRLRDSLR